ncbi:LacI family transcriptional regulator [Sphaerisporangium rufum]|uniref:LacI family transcriptional regulator n=1 Tax=Sphaerisporangium rufum TaxID=1381558 RepID=A0A919R431_9ACTN|nr:LacI family DNA-binding transcriptional regulator [Sphaerisporangium rufum]GII76672.1 LacI family transcriptional regulator [Sphaerisporangium rufum]
MTVPDPTARTARRRRDITVARIAEMAGVSPPTVSKVINGHAGVSTATRRRIEELIREHGWQRRPERAEPATMVELLFRALDSLWALEIIQGVEETVREAGMTVALTDMRGGHTPNREWVDRVLTRRPAGVIAVSAMLSERDHERLASRAIPVVAVDPYGEPDHHMPSVGATNWNGGLLATRHLLELGHRRIAMINGPGELLCCRARQDGYRSAMEAAGVPVEPALLRRRPLYVEGGRAAAVELLALPDPPTAVFAANDLQALGAYQAALRAGLRVPEDLSVVGFDDVSLARWADPPMTTVRQPLAKMGAAAAGLVLAMAAGERPEHDRVELACGLVVRASTAPPAR